MSGSVPDPVDPFRTPPAGCEQRGYQGMVRMNSEVANAWCYRGIVRVGAYGSDGKTSDGHMGEHVKDINSSS